MKNCKIFFKGKLDNKKFFTYDDCKKIISENVKNGFGEYYEYYIKSY